MREKQILARAIEIQKENWGDHAFLRDDEATIILKLYYLWKMHGYSKFSFWIPRALAKFCFPRIVLNRTKISLY